MPYKIYYSFLHKNLSPNLATKYELYRQEVSGSNPSDYFLVKTISGGNTGNPALISGFDEVDYCNVRYNYKAIAFVGSDSAESIDAIVEGISFPCPSFTSTPTPTISVTPTITTTPSNTIPPALSSVPFPTATNTPTSVSQTVTPTITKTPSATTTVSATHSVTPSLTITPSFSPEISPTTTTTTTPSVTKTSTTTPSVTPSLTSTPSPTLSPGSTPSPTITKTPTISVTSTVSPTISPSLTKTVTPTISVSSTQTVTPTISQTPAETVTPTISVSPMQTVTPTISVSSTQTVTPTISQTPAETVTPTISVSPTQTVTPTISVSPTQTATPTISVSPTQTVTPTITHTPTQTTPISCVLSPVTIKVESEFISPGNSVYKYITSDQNGNGGLFGCIDVNRGETLTIFVTGDQPNIESHPLQITNFNNLGQAMGPLPNVVKTDLTSGPTEDYTYSLTWVVPCDETIDKYQYQCENHAHMRGTINVIGSCPTPSPTPTISVSPTQTVTPTISVSPTQTVTPTTSVSPTQTVTPTISVTPTMTPLPMTDSVQTYMPIHMQSFLTLELRADLWDSEQASPGTIVPVYGSHSPNNWYNFDNNRSDNTWDNFLTYPLSYAERLGSSGPQSSVFGFHGSSTTNSSSTTRIFKSPQATNESRTYCFWFKAKDLNRTQCLLCDSFMWNGVNDSLNSGITMELNSPSHLSVTFSCFSKLSNINFYPFVNNPLYNGLVPFEKPFSFSKWNHVALVVDVSNQFASLYVNKFLVTEFTNSSDADFSMLAPNFNTTVNANNSLTWGMRYFYSSIRDEHFRGLMNQMTVMENHISTSSTIANIYNEQSPYYNYLNNSSSAQSEEDDYFDF